MRETRMALVDAQKVGMTFDDAQKFGLSKPERLPMLEDETLIRGNRTKTGEGYCFRDSVDGGPCYQLWNKKKTAQPSSGSFWLMVVVGYLKVV
jgi:hypothetical protein